MRRLPIFFVLDCSESMVGEKLKKMEDGLQSIIRSLRTEPHALETAYISVIAFAGIAKTITPLIETFLFYPPKLPLGGGTNLGAALDELMTSIDKSVAKTTADRKGDWKPIIYLFTDGRPTNDPTPSITRWKCEYSTKTTLIAVGLGKDADFSVLNNITNNTLIFEETEERDFKKFIDWVTSSIVAQSKSVNENREKFSLSDIDDSILKVAKKTLPLSDETCVTLVGRCQKTSRPYIIKYEREITEISAKEFKLNLPSYHLAGCFPLEEDYFTWSDNCTPNLKINTSLLVGSPGCPHCGSITAFAVCQCSNLMCLNNSGEASCPWCKKTVMFDYDSVNEDGFDVKRGRG